MLDYPRPLIEHLKELRRRIIICLFVLILFSIFIFPFSDKILNILKNPAPSSIKKLAIFSPQEGFLIYTKISFFSGFLISMPIIFYNIWVFILPAIGERFKRYVLYFIFFSFFFFVFGCLFAYFILIPPALKFLLSFAKDNLEPVISANKYISFVISIIFASGLSFLLPVLSFILTKLKLINYKLLKRYYRFVIVFILIFSAIITPTTDIFNMLLLAIPIFFLYLISILISFFAKE